MTPLIDASWYERPQAGKIKERTSAGGIVVRVGEDGRVYAALCREQMGGAYILPKGGVERGETLLQTARREIEEEAGLRGLQTLAYLGTRERLSWERTRWITTHYWAFLAPDWGHAPTDPRHAYRADWFPIGDGDPLPPMIWPEQAALLDGNRARLRALAHGDTMIPERTRSFVRHGLAATPELLDVLVPAAERGAWDRRPDPDRFTAREAVAHLADWDAIWIERLQSALHPDGGVIAAYDADERAASENYAASDPHERARHFRGERARLLALVDGLAPGQWERAGRHPVYGAMTVYDLLVTALGHDGYHLRQVAGR